EEDVLARGRSERRDEGEVGDAERHQPTVSLPVWRVWPLTVMVEDSSVRPPPCTETVDAPSPTSNTTDPPSREMAPPAWIGSAPFAFPSTPAPASSLRAPPALRVCAALTLRPSPARARTEVAAAVSEEAAIVRREIRTAVAAWLPPMAKLDAPIVVHL